MSVRRSERTIDHSAAVHLVGRGREDRPEVGLSAWNGRVENLDDFEKLRAAGAGPHVDAAGRVEKGQPGGVALLDQHGRQAGRDRGGLGELGRSLASVIHRGRRVEQEPRAQVRFLFVALDIEPVGPRIGAPIEVLQVVAERVFPVVVELGGDALERTAVQAGDGPLDGRVGMKPHGREPGNHFRL